MSKLLERLDELEKAATPGPWLDACILVETEEQKDMASYWGCPSANLAVALRNAYPKLRAVVEAAREVVRDPYTDEIEHLAGTLKALEEGLSCVKRAETGCTN